MFTKSYKNLSEFSAFSALVFQKEKMNGCHVLRSVLIVKQIVLYFFEERFVLCYIFMGKNSEFNLIFVFCMKPFPLFRRLSLYIWGRHGFDGWRRQQTASRDLGNPAKSP